ncbi:hypothetical protein ABIB08_007975 [Bradyrhizobium sp. RT11b]
MLGRNARVEAFVARTNKPQDLLLKDFTGSTLAQERFNRVKQSS